MAKSRKTLSYPKFVKSDNDRTAYDVARKGKWEKYILHPGDLRAIENGCYFELAKAQRVEAFFYHYLRHSKGQEFAGQPFILQEWQRDSIIYPLYGWMRPDGTRRFRTGFIFIPKKNGKSALASGLSLYHLIGDNEPGAEVYNAGVDRSNAKNVFTEAMNMAKKSPELTSKLDFYPGVNQINYTKTNSLYKALSADGDSAEGKNISFLVYDELHAVGNRKLYDALMGGGISRRQPLMLVITTAGAEAEGTLCYDEYLHAKKVQEGSITDESYFVFIAEGDPKLDPADPVNLKLANPGLGVSPTLQALLDRWSNAQDSPAKIATFKRYHLNLWVKGSTSAITPELWDRGATSFDPDDLLGQKCWGGIDLGSTSDLCAMVLIFEEGDAIRVLAWFWIQEDRIKDRDRHKVSYAKWVADGVMEETPGNRMDYHFIRQRIAEICAEYDLQALAIDSRFQGKQLAGELFDDGLPVVEYNNTLESMASPTTQFLDLVQGGLIHHNGNPVLRWMAPNLILKDVKGSLYPEKGKSHNKIDGIVSIIMALGVRGKANDTRSVYENPDKELLILGDDEGNEDMEELDRKEVAVLVERGMDDDEIADETGLSVREVAALRDKKPPEKPALRKVYVPPGMILRKKAKL